MASDKKFGAGGRKQFVRTKVPAAERISSAIILLLVAVIAWAIYHKGKVYDPNRYAVRTDSLKFTAAAVEGKDQTVRSRVGAQPGEDGQAALPKPVAEKSAESQESSGEGGAEGSSAGAKPVVKGEPLEISLPGTKPMGDTEFYNADNLFEKIDGRAPA